MAQGPSLAEDLIWDSPDESPTDVKVGIFWIAGKPRTEGPASLLANIYLHYVFDLWAERWRRLEAKGDMIVVHRSQRWEPRKRAPPVASTRFAVAIAI